LQSRLPEVQQAWLSRAAEWRKHLAAPSGQA
jgi:hypothetical protein